MPGSSGINHDVFRYRVGVMGVDSMDSCELHRDRGRKGVQKKIDPEEA
jgi:hypothetical protein